MNLSAKITAIDSKQATGELSKEADKALKSVKAHLDAGSRKEFYDTFTALAKSFGKSITTEIKNALGEIEKITFTKTGGMRQRNETIPRYVTQTFTPSGSARGMKATFDTQMLQEAWGDMMAKSGMTDKAIKDFLRKSVASSSGLFNLKRTSEGYSGVLTAALKNGLQIASRVDFDRQMKMTGIDESTSNLQMSSQSRNALKKISTNNAAYREQLKIVKSLKATDEERAAALKKIASLQVSSDREAKKLLKADKERYEVNKRAQKTAVQTAEANVKEKLTAEESKKARQEVLRIEQDIQRLKMQNIEVQDKTDAKEIIALNNQKIAQLEEQQKLQSQMLTQDDKEIVNAKQKSNLAKEQTAQINKQYKIRSSRNTKGNFFDELKTATQRVISYGAAYKLQQMALNQVTTVMQTLVDFDKYATNIRIVTGETTASTKELVNSYIELGKTVGSTTQKVVEAADLWLRQGRSVAETNELIRATMVMANVASIDSAKAADLLTSSMNGYKMAAKDAMRVVDVFSAIDLAAAANTEELAEALQRVAATASEAGVSFENVTSYIATLVDVTRLDAGSIGSAKILARNIEIYF